MKSFELKFTLTFGPFFFLSYEILLFFAFLINKFFITVDEKKASNTIFNNFNNFFDKSIYSLISIANLNSEVVLSS